MLVKAIFSGKETTHLLVSDQKSPFQQGRGHNQRRKIMFRNSVIALLLCLLGLNITQAADDPKNIAGYGKTAWGMTPDQVLNAEAPRAEKLEKPLKFKTGLGMIIIKEVQIGAAKFSAIFIFEGSGQTLRQVNLTSFEKKNAGMSALSFSSIEKSLTEEYGAPIYKEESRVASWKLPKTSIDLRHSSFPGVVTQVTINYRPSTVSGRCCM